jgi:lysine/ornithine N-monooxygenase
MRHGFARVVCGLFVTLAALFFTHRADASASVIGHELIRVSPAGQGSFDFTFKLVVRNQQPALDSATIVVATGWHDAKVLQGNIALGAIPADTTITTEETFVVRLDHWERDCFHKLRFEVIPGAGRCG